VYFSPHTFADHVGDGFRTQEAPPRTRAVPPPHCGAYFALYVLCSIHRSMWTQEVPPRTLEAPPPRMRCVLSFVCTLLHIHVSVTLISGYPCSGFSNTVFSIQEYCIRKFRGLCIKGVSRVRSTEIPLSRIQEFMNISLFDNFRYYNQSSVCAIYHDNRLWVFSGVQYQEYSIREMWDSRGGPSGFKR